MKAVHTLKDLHQVKLLADPMRFRILEAFSAAARTTKQVAERLGEPPTKLYHHVDLLARAGLITLVDTRQNRGTVEKYYRAVAREFVVDRKFLELTKGPGAAAKGYAALFLSAFETSLAEARQAVDAGLIRPVEVGRNAFLYRKAFARHEDATKVLREIRGLIKECQQSAPVRPDVDYGLVVALYPIERKRPRRRRAR